MALTRPNTIRTRISDLFWWNPGAKLTATRIAYEITARLDTVSSALTKMVDSGQLQRRNGGGPRGGYVYFMKERG